MSFIEMGSDAFMGANLHAVTGEKAGKVVMNKFAGSGAGKTTAALVGAAVVNATIPMMIERTRDHLGSSDFESQIRASVAEVQESQSARGLEAEERLTEFGLTEMELEEARGVRETGESLLLEPAERAAAAAETSEQLERQLEFLRQQEAALDAARGFQEDILTSQIQEEEIELRRQEMLSSYNSMLQEQLESQNLSGEELEAAQQRIEGQLVVYERYLEAIERGNEDLNRQVEILEESTTELENGTIVLDNNNRIIANMVQDTGEYEDAMRQVLGPTLELEDSLFSSLTTMKAIIASAGILTGVLLVQQGASMFGRLESFSRDFAEQTGVSKDNLEETQRLAAAISEDFARYGMDLEDAGAILGAMDESFGSIENATRVIADDSSEDLVRNIGMFAANMRLSGEEAAEVIQAFDTMASLTDRQTSDMLVMTRQLAEQANVAPRRVMQDIAASAENLAIFSGRSADSIGRAAVEARRLGTNLENIVSLQEKFLTDIPNVITQVQETALFVQTELDPTALISAAAASTEEFLQEFRRQFGEIELDELDPFQMMQLREIGIPLEELDRMNRLGESLDELATNDLILAIRTGDASFEDAFEASDTATLLEDMRREFAAMGAVITREIGPPVIELANIFLPAITAILRGISSVVEVISVVTGSIAGFFADITQFSQDTSENVDSIGAGVSSFLTTLGKVAATMAAIVVSAKVIGAIFTGFSFLSVFPAAAAAAAGGITTALGGMARILTGFGRGAALLRTTAVGLLALAGSIFLMSAAAKNFEEVGWSGILLVSAATGIMIIAGQALAAMSPKILIGAGALFVFGGALWVASRGALNFAESMQTAVPQIVALAEVGFSGLLGVATGISAIGTAMAGLGGGGMIAAIREVFGGNVLNSLSQIASKADEMHMVANAVERIAASLAIVAGLNATDISGVMRAVGDTPIAAEAQVAASQVVDTDAQDVVTAFRTMEDRVTEEVTTRTNIQMDDDTIEKLAEALGLDEIKTRLAMMVGKQEDLVVALMNGQISINLDGRKVSREHYMRNRNNQLQ